MTNFVTMPTYMNPKLPCTIYLVRHGQSQANVEDVYGLDTPLSQVGVSQMNTLCEKLRNTKFDAIYSSNLLRSKQSAHIIAQKHNLEIHEIVELREREYGVLEGRKGSEVEKTFKELFIMRSSLEYEDRLKFKFSPTYESDEELMRRIVDTLTHLASNNLGKTILIVSHVAAIKSLLLYLTIASHSELEGQAIKNSGYVIIAYDGQSFHLLEINGQQGSKVA